MIVKAVADNRGQFGERIQQHTVPLGGTPGRSRLADARQQVNRGGQRFERVARLPQTFERECAAREVVCALDEALGLPRIEKERENAF